MSKAGITATVTPAIVIVMVKQAIKLYVGSFTEKIK